MMSSPSINWGIFVGHNNNKIMTQDIAKAIRREFTTSNPLPVSSSGGAGDASAANQASQIVVETALATSFGAASDVTATSDTGTFSLISFFKRLLSAKLDINLSTLNTAISAITTKLGTLFDRPTITITTGTIAASGDTTIIAAPGSGASLNIAYLRIQLEASTATTVLIKSGSTTIDKVLCQNQGDGLVLTFFTNRETKLTANQALILNLSGANSVSYTFHTFNT